LAGKELSAMSVLSNRTAQPRRERVVKNPFPWYTPRFWHGMRVSTWFAHLAKNRFDVSVAKLPTVASVSAVTLLNSALAEIDRLVYRRRISQVELKAAPLFILGHWRSGTTFLHELLIRDPAHTFPSTYQCFAPHHFVFSESWVTPLTKGLLPSRRPMDNMAAGWQRPQEDEFALGNLGQPTPYMSMMFPRRGPAYPDYLDLHNLTSEQIATWKDALAEFFRRITYRDNRRIIVKSPAHTARVRTLLEMFPNAKFVHIVRNPFDVFASTVNLWKSLNEVQRIQATGDQAWIEQYVLDGLQRMYAAFEADRQLLADDQLYELRYEDLIEDPADQMRQIYQQLNLGDFEKVEPAVAGHLAEVKNYRTNHYSLAEETRNQIRNRWNAYFQQYGYDAG
jgi:hypothetical protein